MSIKILEESELFAWVSDVIEKQKVIGVQKRDDNFVFAPLVHADELRLDYDVTVLPPKQYLQPPCEKLLTFDSSGAFSSVIESEPFVLFGVHPYDMAAITQMDDVFSMDHEDIHYVSRRKAATIIMCDVQRASQNVFAGSMGTATCDEGFDIRLTKVEAVYLVESASDKGDVLMKLLKNASDADDSMLAGREKVWDDNRKLLRKYELKPSLKKLPDLLADSYDHPVWESKSLSCFSCGSCVLVCPTCYCFDVKDDLDWDLKSGKRSRAWDGCMLQDFALVAGDHNFRKKVSDRYRHRYFRKGKYMPDKTGKVACVGCGRCITACVPKIANPAEIFNTLAEDK